MNCPVCKRKMKCTNSMPLSFTSAPLVTEQFPMVRERRYQCFNCGTVSNTQEILAMEKVKKLIEFVSVR